MALILWLACGSEPVPAPQPEPRFVRDGVILEGGSSEKGIALTGGRRLLEGAWPEIAEVQDLAPPLQPECVPLYSVMLEDQSRLASLQAPAPGAALAFSQIGRAHV